MIVLDLLSIYTGDLVIILTNAVIKIRGSAFDYKRLQFSTNLYYLKYIILIINQLYLC